MRTFLNAYKLLLHVKKKKPKFGKQASSNNHFFHKFCKLWSYVTYTVSQKITGTWNRNKKQQTRAQLRVFPSPKQNTDYSFFLRLYVNKETLKIKVSKNNVQVRRGPRGTTAQVINLSWFQTGIVAGVCPSWNQLRYCIPCWYNPIRQNRGFSARQIHCPFFWKDSCWRQAHLIKLTQRGTQGSPGNQAFVHFTKSIEKAKVHNKNQNCGSKNQ